MSNETFDRRTAKKGKTMRNTYGFIFKKNKKLYLTIYEGDHHFSTDMNMKEDLFGDSEFDSYLRKLRKNRVVLVSVKNFNDENPEDIEIDMEYICDLILKHPTKKGMVGVEILKDPEINDQFCEMIEEVIDQRENYN